MDTILVETIRTIILEGKETNAELEQVIQRYKDLFNRYEMSLGFKSGNANEQSLHYAKKQIEELETLFLYFKSMEQHLEHAVEAFEMPDSNFAKSFE